jgi:hypothetical protein
MGRGRNGGRLRRPDDEIARVHVFDANACDVGPWASIPVRVLIYVDNHMGTPA